MLFSSVTFLFLFLPITLLVYYLVPKRFKNLALLVASLFFYAWGEPVYVILMILSIAFNYACGREITKKQDDRKAARTTLIIAIVVNIGLLGVFKYTGFLAGLFGSVFPVDTSAMQLALPIGISFYTFQALSYLIDVYRGNAKSQKNIINFAVYITMFPQLIAGPIVRYTDIEQQLKNRSFSWAKFGHGCFLFLIGLAKKLILANGIGAIFDSISAQVSTNSAVPGVAWIGAISYMLQIYFDFSGYSDMAIGLGYMFGFQFRKNFNYPYVSRSVTDFWRRWHISLSSWFREYVYIPLGGNRVSVSRHIFNLMLVWFLTGLWHGASWTFILWGVYYGVLLVLEKYVWGKALAKLPRFVQHLYSLLIVLIGWVFFFSDSLRDAIHYLGTMFGAVDFYGSVQTIFYVLSSNWLLLLVGVVCSTAIPITVMNRIGYAGRRKVVYVCVMCVLFVLSLSCLITESYNPFLYFRF